LLVPDGDDIDTTVACTVTGGACEDEGAGADAYAYDADEVEGGYDA
jgi:hypothetical protein